MSLHEQPQPETFIGHYRLGTRIGRGGMGLVYLAEDTRLNRRVAIKCLRTELFEPHYRERFRREALLLAKLNHPHIVHIYDYIESDEQLALVMEYIDGQNLHNLLREQIVPISQRMRWLVQIAQGLAVAHEAGIIHRDLKAENILINKQGLAKISDLGIAKSQDFNATLTDHVAGSYCSMSPEQAMGEEVSFKSDLFSFGILAYQLLCGAHPFGDAENKLQIMQRIISHPPIAPSKSNPDLPQPIANLLGQLLSKNPDNRPDSTQWVAAQLEQLSSLLQHETLADDTIAVTHAGTPGTQSGARATRVKMTRDHPTFETRYQGRRASDQSRLFIAQHWPLLLLLGILIVVVTGASLWQLQPKPPTYVAVIPPRLTAEGMDNSQQTLIQNVIYDALQQGLLQLHGYYLIPREEIADIGEDIEQIWHASAADEIVNTSVQCRLHSCKVTMTRLISNSGANTDRKHIHNTKSFEVLTDDYRSIAEFIQSNLGTIYSKNIQSTLIGLNDQEYRAYIQANEHLNSQGASRELLTLLDQLSPEAKRNAAVQSLYREIALDLFYESSDKSLLEKLDTALSLSKNDNHIAHLYNLFSLQIAKNDLSSAMKTVERIESINPNPTETYKLYAYIHMAQHDYEAAVNYYKRALNLKSNAHNLYNISLAYWHLGNYELAEQYIQQSLQLMPSYYKSHRLQGLVSLYKGNLDGAASSFEAIVTNNDVAILGNLGITYLLLNRYGDAYTKFEQALALAPDQLTLLLNMADTMQLSGNEEKARKLYNDILLIISKPKTNEELRTFAQVHAHLGNHTEAIRLVHNLQRVDPQNIDTIYTAALVYALAGENSSAVVHIESALTNNLSSVWFKFSWFDTLCRLDSFIRLMSTHGAPQRCGTP